jgi:hypothetical protein
MCEIIVQIVPKTRTIVLELPFLVVCYNKSVPIYDKDH